MAEAGNRNVAAHGHLHTRGNGNRNGVEHTLTSMTLSNLFDQEICNQHRRSISRSGHDPCCANDHRSTGLSSHKRSILAMGWIG